MHTLGILGGMSPESTATYYARIVQRHRERRGDHAYPRMILASVSFQRYIDWQHAGDWSAIAGGLDRELTALQSAGAHFAVLATNTMHKVLPSLSASLPILTVYDAVAAVARARGVHRVALTGTRFTMSDGFYADALRARGLAVDLPDDHDQAEIHRIIYEELIAGRITPSSVERFRTVCEALVARGADAVLLACTELELLTRGGESRLPLLDTTRAHAEAAWSLAAGEPDAPVLEALDLGRFLRAQEPVLDDVRRELSAGRKRTHWMWFVFPQLRGLGSSAMATRYGITSLEEARAYLAHPILGPRLLELVDLLRGPGERSANAIFGSPDDVKLRSCLTLFAAAQPDGRTFTAALDRYFAGERDPRTLELLAREIET